ncbi:MAG: MltA domain-containing protein [Acidobacteriota bacterium]
MRRLGPGLRRLVRRALGLVSVAVLGIAGGLVGCGESDPLAPRAAFEAPPPPPVDAVGALVPVVFEPPPDGRTKAPPALDQLLAKLPPFYDRGAAIEAGGSAVDWSSLHQALERDRDWLRTRRDGTVFTYGPRRVPAPLALAGVELLLDWLAAEPTPEDFGARVLRAFELLESVGDQPAVNGAPVDDEPILVTGYYLPEIAASLTRRRGYDVPIYAPPSGVVRVDLGAFDPGLAGRRLGGLVRGGRLVPLPDRRQMRENGPDGHRVIAWAADRVELFFLEIQGSGILRLPDGNTRRIGYAGANGRPYRSIGRLLIDEGAIPREEMSMQALRAWLAAHPDENDRVLEHNASVVFFRFLDGPPVGNLGVPVTPGRSIAVDQKLLPPGAVGFLATTVPVERADGTLVEQPLERFVVAQDTGGAIRGADRVDFYWGPGDEAAACAGRMRQPGRLFILAPKPWLAGRNAG